MKGLIVNLGKVWKLAFFICFAACVLLLAGQVKAATLLAHYPLEDSSWTGAAGEVQDASGNGRHGQAIGSPLPVPDMASPARPGNPGTCTYGSFPGPAGNGGALSIGGLPVNTTAGAKTSVSFWMYWDGSNSVMPIGWNRHDLWLVGGHFGFNTGNGDVFGIASAGLANRWVHVVAEFTNGNVAANALYIDGVAQALTQRQSTPNNASSYANSTLRVGGWQTDNNYRFSGRIDEVKVYDGALMPAEVTTLFSETHACAPRLALEWRFDECALGAVAGEVLDASGNGNHGTPEGAANTGAGRVCKGGIFNGVSPTRIEPASNFADTISNDFTIAFWANPSTTHQIDGQSTSGTGGTGGQRYALYPAQGTNAWGAGHAGVGVSVGTNGVSVYEHAASYMPALLVWSGAVSGWTHVAVVYQARQPRLYINGSLVATGLTSTFANVHPGLRSSADPTNSDGGVGGGRWGWFNGGVDEFRIYDGALNAAQAASIATAPARSCASCATLAHYRLEEGTWTGALGEVQDSSGNFRHGQALGAPLPVPATASPARVGDPGTCGYGDFNGGALNLPVAANTAAGAKTTVSFWMYWNGANSVMPIGWNLHDLWLVSGRFGFNTANSDVFGISSAGLANRWVHVSAVFTNGSVSANKLYIDGVSQPLAQLQSTPALGNAVVNANLRVSGWQASNGYRFGTRIDEVNVFDGEMTQSQVLALYNATHPCGGAVIPANFNCVAAGESASAGHLFTKLAGTPFNFDVVALNAGGNQETGYALTGDKNVTVELVDGSGSTACASRTPLIPAVSQTLTFAAADAGRKAAASMTVNQAHANLRCRVTDANQAPTVVGCSADNFAIRPQQFTVSANLGGPTLKAGYNFTLTADSGVGANYTGTPLLDTALLRDHNANPAGTLNGSLGAGNGVQSSGTFQYHDVGTLSLLPDAVTDSSFTSVDQPNDCVAGGTSNTLVGGLYGCTIGSAAAGPFGRFYPHHFTYSATLTPACNGFTYLDQPALGINLNLEARSFNEAVTARYTAGYGFLGTFDISGDDGGSAVALSRLNPLLPAFVWNNGVYQAGATYQFNRAANPDGPFEQFALKANILSEPDGVAISGVVLSNTTRLHYGRIKLGNAHGSELLPLNLPLRFEYYSSMGWLQNTLDTCTALSAANVALAFPAVPANHLAACETAVSLTGSAPNYALRLSAPGAGNTGWSDATLNLGATASGQTCLTAGGAPSAATTANTPWLQYPTASNPQARATFGVYKGNNEFIYLRENY